MGQTEAEKPDAVWLGYRKALARIDVEYFEATDRLWRECAEALGPDGDALKASELLRRIDEASKKRYLAQKNALEEVIKYIQGQLD